VSGRPDTAEEIRQRLLLLGLEPERVDLAWIARIKADVEASIAALRSEPGFAAALPMFRPELGRRLRELPQP